MSSLSADSEDLFDDIQDPQNPTYEELRVLFNPPGGLLPGKQCGHPVNVWFKEPRPSPPPARSRKAIFKEYIWKSYLPDETKQLLVSNYISNDDPVVLAAEEEHEDKYGQLHDFNKLPNELKVMTWEDSVHQRLIDARLLETRQETSRRDPYNFEQARWYEPRRPSAFKLFPEAINFIDRLSNPNVKLRSLPLPGRPAHDKLYDPDSWLTKNDILLYRRLMDDGREMDWLHERQPFTDGEIQVCNTATLPQALGTSSIAVTWDEFLDIPIDLEGF